MSTGSSGKPDGGSQPGRPAADTPQRLVVRSLDSEGDSTILGANDTAVAVASRPDESQRETKPEGTVQVRARGPAEFVGTMLSGRYLVTRKVGQGGMGEVYEATHTLIGKRVAVKVLLEKYARREAIVQRLEQEARLASSCQNEHIIDITDFGTTEDGRTFVVMEFLEGESLAECLARETRLPEQRILGLVSQAASALAAAHAKGIVHRDIKPENLFLLRRKDQDFVKVVDFGISKSLRASDEAEEQPRLTQTGMVLGTPLYMSPEQARGDDELDARVDVYALGVIMYEATTGRVPFVGNNYLSVISQVLNEDPQPPRALRPDLSEEFEAVVLRAMAKDRTERYASATELLHDVTALLEDPTRSTERAKITGPRKKLSARSKSPLKIATWIALVAVVIAAVVTTVMMLFRGTGAATKPREPVVVPPPVVIDAAVVPPPPDAPAIETREYTIDTDPPFAAIQQDGVDKGAAPITTQLVLDNHYTEFVASAPGYEDKKMQINPARDTRPRYKMTLKKLPTPPPPVVPPRMPGTVPSGNKTGSGSAGSGATGAQPSNKTGGELGGNPFKGNGATAPPKP